MVRDVRATLEALPSSATRADLNAAVERVTAPFRVADQESEALKREDQNRAETKHAAELRWITLLSHINTRLGQIEQKDRITFDSIWDRCELRRKLEERIKQAIITEIINDQSLSDAQLKQRIAALVDQQYKEFCECE